MFLLFLYKKADLLFDACSSELYTALSELLQDNAVEEEIINTFCIFV